MIEIWMKYHLVSDSFWDIYIVQKNYARYENIVRSTFNVSDTKVAHLIAIHHPIFVA